MKSVLQSPYIIDGVQQRLTPAQIIGGSGSEASDPGAVFEPVVDESIEPGLDAFRLEDCSPETYLSRVLATRRAVPIPFAANYTRGRVAEALIDALWHKGHFRIGDLELCLDWCLDPSALGNMAAFYRSVEAAGDYLSDLGLEFSGCSCTESEGCSVSAKACIASSRRPEDLFVDQPYRTDNPVIRTDTIPCVLDPDPQSWLIYIPFDTAEYRLGGSLLAQAAGQTGGVAPLLGDADYFIDCYEVVRELVEDGVAISGATVMEGGLMTAVSRMAESGTGVSVDLSDMMKASGEQNALRLLFAEIPGVLVQVRDMDFDYLDAELLLQDVAYFPLGHPLDNGGKIELKSSAKTGLQNILESLIRNQGAEGED